jgi:hypothetical protein
MDLLIYSNANQAGKLLLNTDFSSAVSAASGLGYPDYLITQFTKTVVVNNQSGFGYQAFLTGSSNTQINLMVFDSSEASALNYITTNYPSVSIVNFGKNNITVQ